MESLRRIESLPASRRSSFIGQAGVVSELRDMQPSQAFAWLEKQLASPVSKDWGQLLFALSADSATLKHWLTLSKEHALAAADAARAYAESGKANFVAAVLPALQEAAAAYSAPRLRAALETLEQFGLSAVEPIPNAALERAEAILSNRRGLAPAAKATLVAAHDHIAKWSVLLHGLDRVHCVAILDWKSSPQEQLHALRSLPAWATRDDASEFAVTSVDIGSDEIVLIALPSEQLREIESLAAPMRFAEYRVAA